MSRIINKLAEASGGWENFLYQILKDVVEKVEFVPTDEAEDTLDEAREILAAYEEIQPDQAKSHVKVPSVVIKSPIKVEAPVQQKPTVDMRPKKQACQIYVDEEVGGSNGSLPLPIGHILSDRSKLKITSIDGGVEFASSEADGQIKSSRVSGHISADGKYRLVFQKVDIGKALIHYEHVPGPSPKPASAPLPAPVGGYVQPAPVVQQVNPAMVELEERIATEGQEL